MIATIALIVSIISLILTAIKYYLDYKAPSSLDIDVFVTDCLVDSNRGKLSYNEMIFINYTNFPVSILDLKLIALYPGNEYHIFTPNTEYSDDAVDSLPLNLEPYQSVNFRFYLDEYQNVWEIMDNIKVKTNKGIFEKKFILESSSGWREESLTHLKLKVANKEDATSN